MENEKGKVKKGRYSRIFAFQRSFLSFFFLLGVLGCGRGAVESMPDEFSNPFASYNDIPGITHEEITAIEALQQGRSIIFGTPLNTEAFIDREGNINGYIALYCDWLTSLLGIKVVPEIFVLRDMLEKLNSRELDFGVVRGREELREDYLMTSAIGERMIIMMRIKGSEDIHKISKTRLPRYAFIQASSTYDMVANALGNGTYEAFFVENYEAGYTMLKNAEVDALVEANIIQGAFVNHDDAYAENFLPLLFNPIVMITAKTELEPVISVVNKALQNGAMLYLIRLYDKGYRDYMKYKMFIHLSNDELEYIDNHPVVPIVAVYDNYPVCFYNTREGEWQGIFFDLFDEITAITGISFNIINESNDDWPVIYEMVKSGEAALIAEMVRTEEREAYFIWPETEMPPDYFALISKSDYRDITINEIIGARVGLAQNTVYANTFKYWFPNHTKTVEYENMNMAVSALQRDEVDLVMSTKGRLMLLTHYLELPGYKANIVFDQPLHIISGVNKNEKELCSIIDKALNIVDNKGISDRWMRKTYDYRAKVAEARLPWFIGASTMSVLVLTLLLVMFLRGLGTRKRLVQLVAKETSTLTAILDGTPDHIFCKDLDSRYTRYNKSFKDYYNLRKSAIGKIDSETLGLPSDLVEYHKSVDNKVFTERETVIFEILVPSYDGMSTLFEVIKSPLFENGKLTGLVGMARDITRRKASEEIAKRASAEAMKASAEAATASEAKSRFIANMSHEMRTPMNVIVGLTDLMLEEESLPENTKETLKKINTAGNTLMDLINDVLDISKIESGKQNLNPVQYDVASFLNDIIALNMIRIESKPIAFKLDINEKLPRSLFGDDLRVKQILNNLLSNAFKYTKEGDVTLGVDCKKDSDGVRMSFCISDTGIGIRNEDIEKLFSDYNQVDTRANREIVGTGLGLSITKKFVEMMDGEIKVESEYGKGTVFRVQIRQGFVTDEPIGKETAENLRSFRYSDKKKQKQGKFTRQNLSYAKVLVVDDFPTNLDVAAGMLHKYKMQVDCKQSGQEAVDLISSREPFYDAVFMDHMMPSMDGIEATKLIRALDTKYAKNIPIIALTANAIVGNEQMFLENGFNAYLPKPFNAMALDAIVQKWVRDKSRE